ncbi:MAG: hypothetical protein ABFR65_08375 [Pseudomonadota bacterium]
MTIFTCKSMRSAVITSAVLLVIGTILLSPVVFMSKPLPAFLVPLVYPGFATLVMSPLVLLVAALASLVPSVNERLQNCQH